MRMYYDGIVMKEPVEGVWMMIGRCVCVGGKIKGSGSDFVRVITAFNKRIQIKA